MDNNKNLTRYEQETIINYNQEEKTCSCYTMDAALIRKLDKLCQVSKEITLATQTEDSKTYNFPKKWLKVRMPKQLTDEQREKMAQNARARFGFAKNAESTANNKADGGE
jgi:hypothetical protein